MTAMASPSPFEAAHRAAQGVLQPVEGAQYPIRFTHPFAEHQAARSAAVVIDLSFLGKLELAGPDAREFLQRIASADLSQTPPGQGHASYLLNGQGKVVHAFDALATPDGFLLITESGGTGPIAKDVATLQFGEKIQLQDYSDHLGALLLAGPRAEAIVSAAIDRGALPPEVPRSHAFVGIEGASVLAIRDARAGIPGLLLLVPRAAADAVLQKLLNAGQAMGLQRAGLAAFDTLRIEAGLPRFGLDFGNDLFPQEIAIDEAFSLSKGCYPGQETVARIDTYGKTHRKLVGLVLDSPKEDVPQRGDRLLKGTEEVGEVRSWAISPLLERPVALAVVRTAKAPVGAELEIRSDDGRALTAKVVDFPIAR